MKKICVVMAMVALLVANVTADERIISADQLPQKAKDLVAKSFSGKTVQYVEQDWDDYEVQLNDGTEIKFTRSGDWESVKSYNSVPVSILPAGVGSYLGKNFADAKVIEVEKDWNGFEVKLSNRMEVFFDKGGKHLGQKYDD